MNNQPAVFKAYYYFTDQSYSIKTFHEATDVEFAELSEQIIKEYVKTKEPM